MKEELSELFFGAVQYFTKLLQFVNPIWGVFTTVVCYIVFPDAAYIPPAIGLGCALLLDIITKYYSIGRRNGGLKKAIKTRKISSDSFWRGTKKKIVSILVIMILCGLAFRFTPFLPQIAIGLSSLTYSLMFYREAQSILENLIDAGHEDAKWFLSLIKKKQKEIIDYEGIELEEENK